MKFFFVAIHFQNLVFYNIPMKFFSEMNLENLSAEIREPDKKILFDSQRKKESRLAFRGYVYDFGHENINETIFYCERRRSQGEEKCCGSVRLNKIDESVNIKKEHALNHLADYAHVEEVIRRVSLVNSLHFTLFRAPCIPMPVFTLM